MCNLGKWGHLIRTGAEEGDCRGLIKLMKLEWHTNVTKLAHVPLQVRKFNSRQQLPHPDDIVIWRTEDNFVLFH